MAAKKKPAAKHAPPPDGLLHKAFQPGKDGYTYLYHWVKFVSAAPTTAGKKGAARVLHATTITSIVDHESASQALRAKTTVTIVDHSMDQRTSPGLVCLDLKQPKSARANGQFASHLLPLGTNRKQAEAWINTPVGKKWAGDDSTALAAMAIRVF